MLWFLGGVLGLFLILAGAYWAVMRSIETPAYNVVQSDGAFEVRDYSPLVAATVVKSGPRYDAVRSGFSPLAGYIFAKQRDGDKISMTAPVTQSAQGDDWAVQFIMPAQYSLKTLPKPAKDTVTLTEIPARRMAAVRFSGVTTDDLLNERESALRAWIAKQGLTGGEATYAYYNDPMTPGFLRRNEVLIELQP